MASRALAALAVAAMAEEPGPIVLINVEPNEAIS